MNPQILVILDYKKVFSYQAPQNIVTAYTAYRQSKSKGGHTRDGRGMFEKWLESADIPEKDKDQVKLLSEKDLSFNGGFEGAAVNTKYQDEASNINPEVYEILNKEIKQLPNNSKHVIITNTPKDGLFKENSDDH